MQNKNRVHNFVNLTGKTFGRLFVLSESDEKRQQKPCWVCRCECGTECLVAGSCLRRGRTKSCGCLCVERTRLVNSIHGFKGTRVYRIWSGMWNRCRNDKSKDFPRYGGRGIKVCDRWNSFELFLEDMGEPDSNATIERKNNDLGYCKSNCVWASNITQARNRRSNVILTFNGETLCLSEWSERLGVNKCLLSKRLSRGWSIDATLSTPVMTQFSRIQAEIDAESAAEGQRNDSRHR